jgi:hypothetical protein
MEPHREYRLVDLPGYMAWSNRKLDAGESEALIAHLDATGAWLSPSDIHTLDDQFFEDILADLRVALDKAKNRS